MTDSISSALLIKIANMSKEHKRLIGEKGKVAERMEAVGLSSAGLWALTLTYTEIENRITQVLSNIREDRKLLDELDNNVKPALPDLQKDQ